MAKSRARASETKDGFWRRRDERTGSLSRFWWTNLAGRRTSTGQRDIEAAREWRRERERELASPSYTASRKKTVGGAVAEFLEELRVANRAADTIRYYTQKLGTIVTFYGADAKLAAITPASVTKFVAWRTTDNPLPDGSVEVAAHMRTAAKEVAALMTMVRSAKHRGEFAGDIDTLKPLRMDATYVPRERHPTREQFAAIIHDLERRDMRHRAAWLCAAIATGGRYGEVQRLRHEHVDLDAGRYTLLVSKTVRTEGGRKERGFAERVRPILPDATRLLEYAIEFGDGTDGRVLLPWAAPNMVQTLQRVGETIGVPAFSANDFRRALASWLRQDGVPPDLVAFMLGHTSSAMVEKVYGRMTATAAAALIQAAREIRTESVPSHTGSLLLGPKESE